jgi:hypothetical protein
MTGGADAIQKAVDKKTPGQPRTIRSQVGLTEDPVPEGKKIAQPEYVTLVEHANPDTVRPFVNQPACRHHHGVEPASHGSSDPGNNAGEELSKEGIKGHKEELKHMQVCLIMSSIVNRSRHRADNHCWSMFLYCNNCSTPENHMACMMLQNQASKYDSASNPLNKNAPTQSASDMKGVQQQ